MYKYKLLAALVVCSSGLLAQLDKAWAKQVPVKIPVCYEVTYNAKKEIPKLYNSGNLDSLSSLLTKWQQVCGGAQEAMPVRMLVEIKRDSFYSHQKMTLLNSLSSYSSADGADESNTAGYRDYYLDEYAQIEDDYRAFVRNSARQLLDEKKEIKELEKDILLFYTGDYKPLYRNLRKGTYDGTRLQSDFDEVVEKYRYSSGVYVGIYAGSWTPTNKLSSLGTHPDLGLKVGGYTNRINIDLNLGVRLGAAANEYRVLKDDSMYQSDQFTGFYIGAGMGYALYRGIKSQFDVTAGLGYDGITMYTSDDETGEGGLTLHSINLRAGAEYKFYYNIKNYLALGCAYNFLNYNNNINDDLYGGALSVYLIWGFTDERAKRYSLEKLGY